MSEPLPEILMLVALILAGGFGWAAWVATRRATEAGDRMRRVISSSYEAFISMDEHGLVTDWNRAAEATFGWFREEALGRPLADLVIPERYREAHLRGLAHFLATGEGPALNRRLELFGLHRDGREFPVELTISVVQIGNAYGFNAFVQDISERKQAEEALRASETQLKEAQELARFGNWEWNVASNKLWMSDGLKAIYGVQGGQGEVTIQDFVASIHPDDRDIVRRAVWDRSLVDRPFEFDHRLNRADGETIWLRLTGRAFRDETGKPIRVVGTEQDISERKRGEEALNHLAAIVQSSDDAIIGGTLDGTVTSWNAGAERLYGYTAEEMIGRAVALRVPREHQREVKEMFQRVAQGELVRDADTIRLAKDGRVIDVSVTISPVRDAAGAIIGASTIARDITERKRTEQEIRNLNEDLQRRAIELAATNKELEAFSYSVSHDLRAPLRSIAGFSQSLMEDYYDAVDEQGKDYLNRIRAAAQRMGELIDDLLTLSRVTRSELTPQPVDLSAMAQSISAQLKDSQPVREVEFCIQSGLSDTGDGHLLHLALDNLLGNAWKFTSKHPKARIEFGAMPSNNGSGPVYFVRDDGAGFDMSYADKLFGAFQRLHPLTEFPGTGVGLATVQRIIHRHAGSVWAEGAIEQGATFYFTLMERKEAKDGRQIHPVG